MTNPPNAECSDPSAPKGCRTRRSLALIDSAFERPAGRTGPVESVLVDWLREDSDVIAELTLVAEVDGGSSVR